MKTQHYIAAGLMAALCALSPAVRAQGAPPAPGAAAELPGNPPGTGYVWMGGQWTSESGQWKWVAAHWEQPPSRSAVWVAGHWTPLDGKWSWANGAWSVQNSGQDPQARPEEPQAQSGVPMPSTPAPMVSGQYPEAVPPGQQTVTTDYGPADYSTDYDAAYPYYGYPYYAWSGYPGYWDYPGLALGLGWGPGYVGFGRGYYRGRGFAHGGGPVRGRGFSGHASTVRSGSGGHATFRH